MCTTDLNDSWVSYLEKCTSNWLLVSFGAGEAEASASTGKQRVRAQCDSPIMHAESRVSWQSVQSFSRGVTIDAAITTSEFELGSKAVGFEIRSKSTRVCHLDANADIATEFRHFFRGFASAKCTAVLARAIRSMQPVTDWLIESKNYKFHEQNMAQMLHVWNIYLHLPQKWHTCR